MIDIDENSFIFNGFQSTENDDYCWAMKEFRYRLPRKFSICSYISFKIAGNY